jgi:STE24 endopeptidase
MSELAPDPHRQVKAKEYARLNRRLLLLELGLGAGFMLALLLSGLSGGIRDLLDMPQPARVALYFVIVALGYGVMSIPVIVYRGFVLPHRYGLSCQSWRRWLADEGKAGILGLALGTCLVVVVYTFLESFPHVWWLLAFAFGAVATVVMTRLAPVLIVPLFFKLEPLADAELRARLVRLAERSRTRIRDVFQIDFSSKTSAGNAMIMGWGSTRRIVLSDTMLQDYTPDEIEVVMAHELGHHRHHDIAKLIVIQSVLMLFGFYLVNLALRRAVPGLGLDGISDVAALPLLALVLAALALLLTPLANSYARHLEKAADLFALEATANPDAFASMLTRLTDQNLADSRPGRWTEVWFYDHPPYYKRLELARRFRREERT